MDDLKIKTGKDEQSIRKAVRNLISRKELAWIKRKKNGGSNKKKPRKGFFNGIYHNQY
ncbi:hypothetical protein ACEQPO_11380 [Bacillus sp. SL00103]